MKKEDFKAALIVARHQLASEGGRARARKLTAKQRKDLSRHAANVRWEKYRKK